jgi:branched-subunit amino acid ABC-type transport system permease component
MQQLRSATVSEGFNLLGARITPTQTATFCVTMVALGLLDVLLRSTKLGRVFRAVANDPGLAAAQGVPNDTVALFALAAGSALAGLAGLLTALDVHAHPTMGMNALMLAVVAMIVGGSGNVWGIAAGALLVALAREFGVWKVSSQWQDAIVFAILIPFLLFRPHGFCGGALKKVVG